MSRKQPGFLHIIRSIIVPGVPKLYGYNTCKLLSSKRTFPSAFFSPLLSLQIFEGNISKVKGTSILQGINKCLLSPCCCCGTNSCFLGTYNLVVKKYSSHLKCLTLVQCNLLIICSMCQSIIDHTSVSTSGTHLHLLTRMFPGLVTMNCTW